MTLEEKMKKFEKNTTHYLTSGEPVIIRLDLKGGSKFTKNFRKPFDFVFAESMKETMKYLCENIPTASLGFCNSDEITILLIDYQTGNINNWYDGRQSKIESLSAANASVMFNKTFERIVNMIDPTINDLFEEYRIKLIKDFGFNEDEIEDGTLEKQCQDYRMALNLNPHFDCRAFNIPKDEVVNNIHWRQMDCLRNAKSTLAQAYFTQKQLNGKSGEEMLEILKTQKGINFEDIKDYLKHGSYCTKDKVMVFSDYLKEEIERNKWIVKDAPVFVNDNREIIEKLVYL